MVDKMGRPDWIDYFISMAFLVAQRSLDPSTKHGCIVTCEDKTILAVGYNGPPRNCIDENVPLDRPKKYDWMVHSEESAIVDAARNGVCLKNSIFYITGFPCEKCMRMIINVGAKKVVYSQVGSLCVSNNTISTIKQMLIGQNISMIEHTNIEEVKSILDKTKDYVNYKTLR